MKHEELTKAIIGAAYKVHDTLGAGFLEKVYENAMAIALRKMGISVSAQYPITVWYEEENVGDFVADLLVEGTIIVELKAVEILRPIHEVQVVNYLNATKLEVGLLINFGTSVEVKRKYRTYKPSEQ